MAKKEGNQGRFQTAGPAPRDESGVDVRDLLAFAAGKQNGEAVTRDDIDKIITARGVSNKDARRIRKGADQFFDSGLDYRVTGGGRYNVNTPTSGVTKASRRAGDKAGFNVGDLVKLGRNVSTLVGLADMSSADLAKSKEPKEWESLEGDQKPGTFAEKMKNEKFSWENGVPPSGAKKDGNGAKKKTFIDPDQFTLPPLGPFRIGDKPKGLAEYARDYKGPVKGAPASKPAGTRTTESGFETTVPEATDAPFWQQLLFGDAAKLWDGQNWKDLGTVYNPAQFWDKDARDKASALGKARNVQYGDQAFKEEGLVPKRKATGELLSVSAPDSSTYVMKDGKLVNEKGKGLSMPPQTIGLPNPGLIGTPGKGIVLKTPAALKNAGKSVKDFLAKSVENTGKALSPGSIQGGLSSLPAPTATSLSQAQQVMRDVAAMPIDDVLKQSWLQKMSNFIKTNKQRLQDVDDAAAKGYSMDNFKKGGKLPTGRKGITFDEYDPLDPGPAGTLKRMPRYNPPKIGMDFGTMPVDNSFMPYQSLNNTAANYMNGTAGYKGTLNVGRAAKLKEAGVTPMETPDFTKQGTLLSRTPGLGDGQGDLFGKDNVAGDVAGKVAKYALPFIGEGLARKELNKIKPAEFKTAEFMTGAVRDLPRPNMNLRYREPVGPDVQSEIAGQKFADAQQRDAEANYQIQNSMSKISQLDQILNRTNQGEMFNTQGKNQNSMFNAQMKAQVSGARADSMKEPFIAAQQHLATDISTGAYLSSAKKSQLAEEILKYEKPGSDRYEEAVRWLAGNKAKGGKSKPY